MLAGKRTSWPSEVLPLRGGSRGRSGRGTVNMGSWRSICDARKGSPHPKKPPRVPVSTLQGRLCSTLPVVSLLSVVLSRVRGSLYAADMSTYSRRLVRLVTQMKRPAFKVERRPLVSVPLQEPPPSAVPGSIGVPALSWPVR